MTLCSLHLIFRKPFPAGASPLWWVVQDLEAFRSDALQWRPGWSSSAFLPTLPILTPASPFCRKQGRYGAL